MAPAPNLRSEKRRDPSGGGGGGGGSGSSARRARTARPRVPAQTDTHTLTHTRTLALTHAHSHKHWSRPLVGGGSGTSSSRNSSSRSGGGTRNPHSRCPLPEPDLGRDQQQRRQQSPRIPPPLLPPREAGPGARGRAFQQFQLFFEGLACPPRGKMPTEAAAGVGKRLPPRFRHLRNSGCFARIRDAPAPDTLIKSCLSIFAAANANDQIICTEPSQKLF